MAEIFLCLETLMKQWDCQSEPRSTTLLSQQWTPHSNADETPYGSVSFKFLIMSPDRPPRISAIIPIYGQMSDLPRLLDKLEHQTLVPCEIIVVDSSPKPLENPPPGVRFVKNPRDLGLAC